jgi:hypothetical protein
MCKSEHTVPGRWLSSLPIAATLLLGLPCAGLAAPKSYAEMSWMDVSSLSSAQQLKVIKQTMKPSSANDISHAYELLDHIYTSDPNMHRYLARAYLKLGDRMGAAACAVHALDEFRPVARAFEGEATRPLTPKQAMLLTDTLQILRESVRVDPRGAKTVIRKNLWDTLASRVIPRGEGELCKVVRSSKLALSAYLPALGKVLSTPGVRQSKRVEALTSELKLWEPIVGKKILGGAGDRWVPTTWQPGFEKRQAQQFGRWQSSPRKR